VSGTPIPSLEPPSLNNGGRFLSVVILGTAFLVSGLDSRSFPLLNVQWFSVLQMFGQVGPGHPLPSYVPLLLQFATVLVAVGVFYLIGLRVDFRRYRLLAVLSFAGALAANALGYLLASTEFGGGSPGARASGLSRALGFQSQVVFCLSYPQPRGVFCFQWPAS
jgi:hypothetical protein